MKIPDGVSGIFLVTRNKAIVGRRKDCCLAGDRQTGQDYRLPLLFLHWKQSGGRLGASSLSRSDWQMIVGWSCRLGEKLEEEVEGEAREKRKRSEHEDDSGSDGGGFGGGGGI